MSMYGDSDYSRGKNDIFDEIIRFLEDHPMEELLRIVADAYVRIWG